MRANTEKTEIEISLDRIRVAFLSGLDQRIEALDELLCYLEVTDAPIPALQGIAEIAHKVSGVGKTLGFPKLGDMANSIEIMISSVLAETPRHDTIAQIVREVDVMVDHMDGLRTIRKIG
jgi:chemotaxis protein histidine kinase CheA